jgi:hypothetical protein
MQFYTIQFKKAESESEGDTSELYGPELAG